MRLAKTILLMALSALPCSTMAEEGGADRTTINGTVHFDLAAFPRITREQARRFKEAATRYPELEKSGVLNLIEYADKLERLGLLGKYCITLKVGESKEYISLYVAKPVYDKCWERSPWKLKDEGKAVLVIAEAKECAKGLYEAVGDVQVSLIDGITEVDK